MDAGLPILTLVLAGLLVNLLLEGALVSLLMSRPREGPADREEPRGNLTRL